MFYIGLYRENMKTYSCLKPQDIEKLDFWYVAPLSGPLPYTPGDKKWVRPRGNMFYIGLYRET